MRAFTYPRVGVRVERESRLQLGDRHLVAVRAGAQLFVARVGLGGPRLALATRGRQHLEGPAGDAPDRERERQRVRIPSRIKIEGG